MLVYYTNFDIKNNNDVSFHYEAYITLSTWDERVLDESYLDPPLHINQI